MFYYLLIPHKIRKGEILMDYKAKIVELINSVTNDELLRYILEFITLAVGRYT